MYGRSEEGSNLTILGKYELLLAIKSLDYEIKELTRLSKRCCDGYVLLKEPINKLCRFIADEHNEKLWMQYGHHDDIQTHARMLRESSMQAVCDMEKYHSLCICSQGLSTFNYLSDLSDAVKEEYSRCLMDENSKVLFIGSGAFPLSALTIAKETGASVLGLDIDTEAVRMSNKIAQALGLSGKVRFSNLRICELSCLHEFTHVMIASLVPQKTELLDELATVIHQGTKIVVRYGNGLKSLFNFPMEAIPEDWRVTRELPPRGRLYDTVLLESHPVRRVQNAANQ